MPEFAPVLLLELDFVCDLLVEGDGVLSVCKIICDVIKHTELDIVHITYLVFYTVVIGTLMPHLAENPRKLVLLREVRDLN